MSVVLRKRKNKSGSTSLYLDIHQNGKRWNEYLPNLKLIQPRNVMDKEQNKHNFDLARKIRNNRALEIEGQDHDVQPNFKSNINFIKYFETFIEKYPNKDKRVIVSTLFRFNKFLEEQKIKELNTRSLTPSLVEDFKNHLEKNLNGETPSNYFKKFKKVLKQATRDKIIQADPSLDIKIKRNESIQKDTLTVAEIQQLADTPITNNQVGKAFIFCCYTGVRWCDVVHLQWKNINLKEKTLNFSQSKTNIKVNQILHDVALLMIGTPQSQDQLLFNLPSDTAARKGIAYWTKKAGIQKHITWHCARHSYGTNLLILGAEGLVVSKLLGHTNMTYTQRYVRIVDKLRQEATSLLPNLNMKQD